MPVQKCTVNGKSGYKWGDNGTCYTGEDAEAKAKKQGQAEQAAKTTTRAGGYADYKPRKKKLDEAGEW